MALAAKPPTPDWLRRLVGDEPFQEVASVTLPGPVSAETMRAVGSFGGLHHLSITGGSTIEGGLAEVSQLDLNRTSITGEGLAHLGGLGKLGTLKLRGSDFSDEGAAALAKLTGLGMVDLVETRISDAGLARLQGMPKLLTLFVGGSLVTEAGFASFRQAAPQVKRAWNR